MTSGFFAGNLFRGLAFRVLFFLSLALLPIGLLAISQTQQLAQQNRDNVELALFSITEKGSATARGILQEAFSAGDALGSTIGLFDQDDAACSLFLGEYLRSNPAYDMVGFLPPDGVMRCSSVNTLLDLSEHPTLQQQIDMPRRHVASFARQVGSVDLTTTVTVPVYEADEFRGRMLLSIPASTFTQRDGHPLPARPVSLAIVNGEGSLITSKKDRKEAERELPKNLQSILASDATRVLVNAKNEADEDRIYAVLEIVPDAAFAISVWPTNTPLLKPSLATRLGTQLPIVMWLASLVVSFWALNRLAIRHIRKLGRQMRRFALNRNLPRNQLASGVPTELIEMESAFVSMGESILRDEAVVEDSLREKNILLKEVHHRVKNNLQLISSIMNMQIRQAKTEDASRVLKRLQERILSLATVHKNLYQTDSLDRVDAAALLHEIVNQALAVGLVPGSNVSVRQDYAQIGLEADDAAPLTLLVSEAITNALKYVDQDAGAKGEISVTLVKEGDDRAVLTISNTTGGQPEHEGTGLGSKLIVAFVRQLNGQVETEEKDGRHTLRIDFPVPQHNREAKDF